MPVGEIDASDNLRAQWARLSAGHGETIAQRAHGLANEYANGRLGVETQAAGLDPAFRLHIDQAQRPLGSVQAAADTSSANRAARPGQTASNSLEP